MLYLSINLLLCTLSLLTECVHRARSQTNASVSLQTHANQPVVDVLVLYTKQAMLDSNDENGARRSSAQMETEIATSYQEANDALVDSGVEFAIRIVHMQQVLLQLCVITLSMW